MEDWEKEQEIRDKALEKMAPVLERIPDRWIKSIDTGIGWFELILETDSKLAAIDPNYTVLQVKEKFGGLRYYTEWSKDLAPEQMSEMNNIIRSAELLADKICMSCGGEIENKPDNSRGFCLDCHRELEERRSIFSS